MIKAAINGFGRIGRPAFKRILEKHPDIEVVAINDLSDPATLAYLLKYDSTYGIYNKTVKAGDGELLIEGTIRGKRVLVFNENDPLNLPWKKLGINVVLECTGVFTDREGAAKHLKAGAEKVIISAPSKSAEIPTFILGVNEKKLKKSDNIIDMGSCTTNCLAPVVKVLNDNLKIIRGFMTTVHSYTNDQRILDLPHKDLRRARAAACNIIPTTTGAAKAIGKALPELEGKLDGISLRVPTPVVSSLDLVCQVEKKTSREDVNYLLKKASQSKDLQGIMGVEDAPLVSSDYKGNCYSSIVDSNLTMAKDNLVKIVSWYDNEFAYACRMAEMAEYMVKKAK